MKIMEVASASEQLRPWEQEEGLKQLKEKENKKEEGSYTDSLWPSIEQEHMFRTVLWKGKHQQHLFPSIS